MLMFNNAQSNRPSTTVSGPVVHVLWMDFRDENFEIYYKRNPTGNPFGIQPISSEIPKQFSLSQNYPNPFNPSSKFKVQISKLSNVKIVVYDSAGREIETLVDEQLKPGTYEVNWNASGYSSGVYFYQLTARQNAGSSTEDYSGARKMLLIK